MGELESLEKRHGAAAFEETIQAVHHIQLHPHPSPAPAERRLKTNGSETQVFFELRRPRLRFQTAMPPNRDPNLRQSFFSNLSVQKGRAICRNSLQGENPLEKQVFFTLKQS
jgi:hypothetical protein